MSQDQHIRDYKGPAAGWGALKSVTKSWLGSDNAFKNLRAMLKTNQNGGFDCPGCAWGESPESDMVKFCENGAKAVNWEATGRSVDPAFFARYSVSALLEQTDYWLEYQGRLTHPMRYDATTDHYVETTWQEAFELIARHLRALDSPDQAEFYTSGRASNEAAFLTSCSSAPTVPTTSPTARTCATKPAALAWRKPSGWARAPWCFTTWSWPTRSSSSARTPAPTTRACSNRCAKPSSEVPRWCASTRSGARPGALPAPAAPVRNAQQRLRADHQCLLPPGPGRRHGSHARYRQVPFAMGREAQAKGEPAVFDHAFIAEHTSGLDDYLAAVDATSWEHIVKQSGLTLAEIELAARIYRKAERVIMCWAMGVTQHRHSVPTVQEIVNLQLLRGNVGKPGAGLSPVRGHSNVQGDRTMGIDEKPKAALLDAIENASSSVCPGPTGTTRCWRSRPWKGWPRCSSPWAATLPKPRRILRAPTRRCATAR